MHRRQAWSRAVKRGTKKGKFRRHLGAIMEVFQSPRLTMEYDMQRFPLMNRFSKVFQMYQHAESLAKASHRRCYGFNPPRGVFPEEHMVPMQWDIVPLRYVGNSGSLLRDLFGDTSTGNPHRLSG